MAGKPLILAALGARGTGKSAWARQQVQRMKPRRLAVWDFMREHDINGTDKLPEFIRAMKAPAWSLAFYPSHDDDEREAQFELWCKAMLAAGKLLAWVEELAFVTKPSKAPPAWRRMTLLGRHSGVSIIGTSQRPASIDKDFLANCDLVHCGRLAYAPDAEKAAMVLGVRADELLRLADLAWVERRAGATDATRGTLSFEKSPPRKRAPKADA